MAFFEEGFRAVFLKVWLRLPEEKRRFPSGMTTKE
jgi:hypothetical protein